MAWVAPEHSGPHELSCDDLLYCGSNDAVASRLVCEAKRRRERAMTAIQGLCGRGLLRHEEGYLIGC